MPSISDNLHFWNSFDWSQNGEEWSRPFGNSETLWWFLLIPRIHRWLPASTILEIGVGYGRWTKFLLGHCERLIGVDLSPGCIEYCRRVFDENERRRFIVNDGMSLREVSDSSVDFIFSFDSIIHAEADVISAYLFEFRRVLRDGGFGFIHHSNLGYYPRRLAVFEGIQRFTPSRWWQPGARRVSLPQRALQMMLSLNTAGWRASSMSAVRFAKIAEAAGLAMLAQETINWGYGRCMIDCLSSFARREVVNSNPPVAANRWFGRPHRNLQQLARLYCGEPPS